VSDRVTHAGVGFRSSTAPSDGLQLIATFYLSDRNNKFSECIKQHGQVFRLATPGMAATGDPIDISCWWQLIRPHNYDALSLPSHSQASIKARISTPDLFFLEWLNAAATKRRSHQRGTTQLLRNLRFDAACRLECNVAWD
jgi:hypothetical protein